MRRILTFISVALATIMSVNASQTPSGPRSIYAHGETTFWSSDGKKIQTVKEKNHFPPKRAPELPGTGESKTIEIELKYDETQYCCVIVAAGQLNFSGFFFSEPEKNMGTFEIPSGINGLIGIFRRTGILQEEDFWIVFKDLTEVESGSKVVLDMEDCIHKLTFEPVGRDGNRISLNKTTKDDEIITKGEFENGFTNIIFYHVDDGTLADGIFFYKLQERDGQEVFKRFRHIYVNDCGPNFMISQVSIFRPSEGRDFTVVEMPNYICKKTGQPSETILKNDPEKFRTYTRKWKRSPYSLAQYDELLFSVHVATEFCNTTIGAIQDDILADVSEYGSEIETHLTVCANDPDAPGEDKASIILIDHLPENNYEYHYAQTSMWWKPDNGKRAYLPLNHAGNPLFQMPYETCFNFIEDNYNKWINILGAPNPWLAYDDGKAKGILGNNCPIISLFPGDYHLYQTSNFVPMYDGLVGRYGESNNDGSINLMGYDETYEYDENSMRKMIYTYDNILIDDEIEGNVSAELGIKEGSGLEDDFVPPVLTYLGMRDSEGYLTDRFETAGDGMAEFYAADFYLDFNWSLANGGWGQYLFRRLPSDKLKIEYAPYQTSSFNELPYEAVPEKDFLPGWGNCYSVPLKNVSGLSSNGWFDMRISMEDESGNTHVQTISPAFYIKDATGVENVYGGNNTVSSVFFNLQGIPVAHPDHGLFIEKRGNKTLKVLK